MWFFYNRQSFLQSLASHQGVANIYYSYIHEYSKTRKNPQQILLTIRFTFSRILKYRRRTWFSRSWSVRQVKAWHRALTIAKQDFSGWRKFTRTKFARRRWERAQRVCETKLVFCDLSQERSFAGNSACARRGAVLKIHAANFSAGSKRLDINSSVSLKGGGETRWLFARPRF